MRIARLPHKRKNNIVIWILVIGLLLLVYASYQVVQLISKAGGDTKPRNLVISNLSTSSATISWVTEASVKGSVVPILSGNEKSPVIDKRGNENRNTHYVELTSLEPNTKYDFKIISGSEEYKTINDTTMSFKTAPITAGTPTPNPIHGTISGNKGDDVVIYAMLKDKSAYPVSTIIPSGGNWITDLSAFRKVSDFSLVLTENSTNLVLVSVGGIEKGAILQGTYTSLFDSNGKLKDTNNLNIKSNSNLYTYFPAKSMLMAESPTTVPPIEPPKKEDIKDTEDGKGGEYIEESSKFRIVMDLEWLDMISGDSVTTTTGVSSVQITNLTDTGFTVLWVSAEKEAGLVSYGTSPSALSSEALDERDGATKRGEYYVHSVSVTMIQPQTKYYFKVKSGGVEYNKTFDVTTYATLNSPPPFDSITGEVKNIPTTGELVIVGYITDKDGSGTSGSSNKISVLADDNGKWILSIADTRNTGGSSYFEYTSTDEIIFSLVSTVDSKNVVKTISSIKNSNVVITAGDSSSNKSVDILKDYGVV